MQTLIITGASGGIGYATAERFAQADWAVINLSRRSCPVDGVRNVQCDLTNPSARAEGLQTLKALLPAEGPLTIVHNAALLKNDSCDSITDDALREVLELNIIAPAALNRTLLPHCGPGSSVLYVGSTLSEKGVPGSFSYVTSKHASIGMMRSTCQDLAGRGIHTACICPGFTDTEMLRDHVPPAVLASLADTSTFGRLVEPAEIAATLWFAANTPAINGAIIHANLGQIER